MALVDPSGFELTAETLALPDRPLEWHERALVGVARAGGHFVLVATGRQNSLGVRVLDSEGAEVAAFRIEGYFGLGGGTGFVAGGRLVCSEAVCALLPAAERNSSTRPLLFSLDGQQSMRQPVLAYSVARFRDGFAFNQDSPEASFLSDARAFEQQETWVPDYAFDGTGLVCNQMRCFRKAGSRGAMVAEEVDPSSGMVVGSVNIPDDASLSATPLLVTHREHFYAVQSNVVSQRWTTVSDAVPMSASGYGLATCNYDKECRRGVQRLSVTLDEEGLIAFPPRDGIRNASSMAWACGDTSCIGAVADTWTPGYYGPRSYVGFRYQLSSPGAGTAQAVQNGFVNEGVRDRLQPLSASIGDVSLTVFEEAGVFVHSVSGYSTDGPLSEPVDYHQVFDYELRGGPFRTPVAATATHTDFFLAMRRGGLGGVDVLRTDMQGAPRESAVTYAGDDAALSHLGDQLLVALGGDTVRGVRLNRAAAQIDEAPFEIQGEGSDVAAAGVGDLHLVCWSAQAAGSRGVDLYCKRVSQAGEVLDAVRIPLSSADGAQTGAEIATNGSDFFVAWRDTRQGGGAASIYGARVSRDGTVIDYDGIPIFTSGRVSRPMVVFDGAHYVVVFYEEHSEDTGGGVYAMKRTVSAVRLTAAGVVLDVSPVVVADLSDGPLFADAPAASIAGLQETRIVYRRSEDEPDYGASRLMTRTLRNTLNGTTCAQGSDCDSGFCVDGICCDTACDGECASCSTGTCTPSPAESVCRESSGDCDLAEVCDGSSLTCPEDLMLPMCGVDGGGAEPTDGGVAPAQDAGEAPDASDEDDPSGEVDAGVDPGGDAKGAADSGGGGCAVYRLNGGAPGTPWLLAVGIVLLINRRRRDRR